MRTWRDWHEVHQPFELHYQARRGLAWCSNDQRWWEFWNSVFEFIRPRWSGHDDHDEGNEVAVLLDIGCGPRPPLARFAGDAEVFAIDPLADEYQNLAPAAWWKGVTSRAAPAEEFVEEWADRFDLVMAWNCLDHTIGWRDILRNMARYGKREAVFGLATDFRKSHVGHPGFEREVFMSELGEHFEIVRERQHFAERDLALVLRRREDV